MPGAGAPQVLSLQDCITTALARNFDLRINRQEPVIAAGRLDSALGAYSPTVSFGVEREHANTPTAGGTSTISNSTATTAGVAGLLPSGATYSVAANLTASTGSQSSLALPGTFTSYTAAQGTLALIEITQPLLKNRRIDSARLALRQGRLALRSAELTAFQQAMETVAGVEQAYFDLLAARETVRVKQSALHLAEQSLADTRNRISIGSLAPLDEKDAQSLAASSRADLLSSQQNLRQKENALIALVTDSFTEWRLAGLQPMDTLRADPWETDYASSAGRALSNRPELEQIHLALDQLELDVRYKEDQRHPSVDLKGSYAVQGAGAGPNSVLSQWRETDHPYYTIGVTVSFPWSERGSRGAISAARGQAEQARLQLAQQREVILGEVDSAIVAVRSDAERITATREARAFAEDALEAEKQKLATGTSTTFAVLQLQRNLVSAQADEIQALADYNKALSTLRLREAATLEFWRIKFAADPVGGGALATNSTSSPYQP